MTAASALTNSTRARHQVITGAAGLLVAAAIFGMGLSWAKWLPYAHKAHALSISHRWAGGTTFADAGVPGSAPTLSGAWHFTTVYFTDVWKGYLVALVVAAAVDALVPRAWLLRMLNRRTRASQALAGGIAALPTLMCTCCASPLAVGLRKRGASTTASLAYWLANPVLNPAVLVFLFLVAPWQFGVTRILVGVPLVFAASAIVARIFAPQDTGRAELPAALSAMRPPDPARLREFPVRFARSLFRLAVILIPLYFVTVLILGLVSGWLADFSRLDAKLGIFAVVVCAIIGTLLVIPTGGEIPVVLALSSAGVGLGSAGALLITLPALSVPSAAMVGRALSWRVTTAMAAAVAGAGLVSGLVLWTLA